MEFWPHRRAKKMMPRVRTWPKLAEPSFAGAVAFKVGMTHIGLIDDSEASSKGSEIIKPVTVLEIPKIQIYGIRLYAKNGYTEPAMDLYVKDLAAKLGIKKTENGVEKLEDIKKEIEKFEDASCLAFLDASPLGFGNKKIMKFELHVGGASTADKVGFIEKWLGKEIKVKDVLAEGDYIDVTSVSKGKGWTGVIKRFGVARLVRKATQKTRHVGTLGPWHPPKVMFTVPMAGHKGFNYRTELNKRVIKIGSATEVAAINVKGGFLHYGNVNSDYLIIVGSIPGPAKRLVRIRKSVRNTSQIKKPQVTYVSLESKQGS